MTDIAKHEPTAAAAPAAASDGSVADLEAPPFERSPRDVLRFAVFGLIAAALIAFMAWSEQTVLGLERDLVELFSFLPESGERILAGLLQIVVVVSSLALLALALLRRPLRLALRVTGYLIGASFLSGLIMVLIDRLLEREAPAELLSQIDERAGIAHTGAGSTVSIAQLTAVLVAIAPFVSRRWRRAFAILLVTVVVVRLTVAAHPPGNVFVAVPVGATVGALLLYALGRPGSRPPAAGIRRALAGSGLAVVDVAPAAVDARGSTPYFATLDNGTGLFVKIVGEENRAAGLLFWAYRSLRLKNVGDEQPYSTLRRGVEHEALMSLAVRDAGIRTPRLRAIADLRLGPGWGGRADDSRAGSDALILATEQIDGASLDRLDADAISDELLMAIWEQVAILRANRMAHRDLRLANIFVADSGEPWLIDFGFGELAASDDLVAADVAQLLASLTVAVGPERAVDSAAAVIGPEAIADALPRLQLPALAGATRTALKKDSERLEALRNLASERSGTAEITYAEVDRLTAKTMILVLALVGAVYFLLPQLVDLPSIIDQIQGADWSRLPWILLVATVTYVGAALTLAGSVPRRLALGPNFMAQLGSSFAGKVAPPGWAAWRCGSVSSRSRESIRRWPWPGSA